MTCLFGTQFDSTADIYTEYHTDNVATGQRIRDWQFNGTVDCKVTTMRTRANIRDFERTTVAVDIPTDILITTADKLALSSRISNVTGGGVVLWTEDNGNPTVFEIESYKPVIGPFGTPIAFEHACRRSSDQRIYP